MAEPISPELTKIKKHYPDLEKMVSKLQRESQGLKSLQLYFRETAKTSENLIASLAQIRSGFPYENLGFDTYHNAMQNVVKDLLQFESQIMITMKNLNQDVIEPLDIFIEHYDSNCKNFINDAHEIFSELEISKKKALKEKAEFLSLSSYTQKIISNLAELRKFPDKNAEEIIFAKSIFLL